MNQSFDLGMGFIDHQSIPRFLGMGEGILTRMSQEVSEWLVNGLQPTYTWDMFGV